MHTAVLDLVVIQGESRVSSATEAVDQGEGERVTFPRCNSSLGCILLEALILTTYMDDIHGTFFN